LRCQVKEVVESEGFWKVYLCRSIYVVRLRKELMMDSKIGKWVMGHESSCQKNALVLSKIFIAGKSKKQGAEKETISGRTPVT